jgi:hypothetical protein
MARNSESAAQAGGTLIAGDAAAEMLFSSVGTCLSRDGTEAWGRGTSARSWPS